MTAPSRWACLGLLLLQALLLHRQRARHRGAAHFHPGCSHRSWCLSSFFFLMLLSWRRLVYNDSLCVHLAHHHTVQPVQPVLLSVSPLETHGISLRSFFIISRWEAGCGCWVTDLLVDS